MSSRSLPNRSLHILIHLCTNSCRLKRQPCIPNYFNFVKQHCLPITMHLLVRFFLVQCFLSLSTFICTLPTSIETFSSYQPLTLKIIHSYFVSCIYPLISDRERWNLFFNIVLNSLLDLNLIKFEMIVFTWLPLLVYQF